MANTHADHQWHWHALIDLCAVGWPTPTHAGYWTAVVLNAAGGFIIAFVLKYTDAVLKCFATTVSLLLNSIVAMAMFGESLNLFFFFGMGQVVLAVLNYSLPPTPPAAVGGATSPRRTAGGAAERLVPESAAYARFDNKPRRDSRDY